MKAQIIEYEYYEAGGDPHKGTTQWKVIRRAVFIPSLQTLVLRHGRDILFFVLRGFNEGLRLEFYPEPYLMSTRLPGDKWRLIQEVEVDEEMAREAKHFAENQEKTRKYWFDNFCRFEITAGN